MKKEKGMSLVLVMGIFVILGIIAVTFITISTNEVKVSKYTANSKIAFHAAEAGLDYGIANIPKDLSAFPASPDIWDTLPNQAMYKSGPPDTVPIPPEKVGEIHAIGSDLSLFRYHLYDISASGKMKRSTREIKAGVRCGPMGGVGTGY